MPSAVWNAVASAFAVTGVFASAANDEVSLVQKDIRKSIMNHTEDEEVKSALAAAYGMMKIIKATEYLNLIIGEEDLTDDGDAKCSQKERQYQLVLAGEATEAAPNSDYYQHLDQYFKERTDCKLTKMQSSADAMSELGSCWIQQTQKYFTPACIECSQAFYRNMIDGGFYADGGCTRACRPFMFECKDAPLDPRNDTEHCNKAAKTCISCAYPHWNDFSQCVRGQSSTNKLPKAMYRIYQGLASDDASLKKVLDDLRNERDAEREED